MNNVVEIEETEAESKAAKVRRQIEKLFTLAGNAGTEEEAMLATAKVQQLCDQYNMDVDEILKESRMREPESLVSKFVSKQIGDVWVTRSTVSLYLGAVVTELFNVRTIMSRVPNALGTAMLSKTNVVGFEINVDSAKMCYDYLEREVEFFTANAKKDGRIKGVAQAQSYRLGMVTRMYDMAKRIKREASADSMALAVITDKAFDEYYLKNNIQKGKAKKFSMSDANAFRQGLDDALKVNVAGVLK